MTHKAGQSVALDPLALLAVVVHTPLPWLSLFWLIQAGVALVGY